MERTIEASSAERPAHPVVLQIPPRKAAMEVASEAEGEVAEGKPRPDPKGNVLEGPGGESTVQQP